MTPEEELIERIAIDQEIDRLMGRSREYVNYPPQPMKATQPTRPQSKKYVRPASMMTLLRALLMNIPRPPPAFRTRARVPFRRSGYGVFWVPTYVSFALNPLNDMVNAASTTFTGTLDGTHPINTIALPFPDGISAPPGRGLGTQGTQQYLTQVVQSITEADRRNHPEAYVEQWNLNVERELPQGFVLSAAYVGSTGTHLAQYSQQINQISDALLAQSAAQVNPALPDPRQHVSILESVPNPFFIDGKALALTASTTTAGQLLRPYPQYTSVQLAGQGSYGSIYHSLQLTVQKRFAGAGSVLVAYTNAKLISDTDTLTSWLETGVGSIQDNYHPRAERSLSSQDVPQRSWAQPTKLFPGGA